MNSKARCNVIEKKKKEVLSTKENYKIACVIVTIYIPQMEFLCVKHQMKKKPTLVMCKCVTLLLFPSNNCKENDFNCTNTFSTFCRL